MAKLCFQYIHQYEFDTETGKTRNLKMFTKPFNGTVTVKKQKKPVKQLTSEQSETVYLA